MMEWDTPGDVHRGMQEPGYQECQVELDVPSEELVSDT